MQILFWDKKDFTILWKKFLNSFMLSFSGVEYVPLGMVYGYIISHGMSDAEYFVIQIVGKMLWVTAGIMIVRRFALTRKIFCIES